MDNGQLIVFILLMSGKEAQDYVVLFNRNTLIFLYLRLHESGCETIYAFGPKKGFECFNTHMIQRPGDRIASPSESWRASLGTLP